MGIAASQIASFVNPIESNIEIDTTDPSKIGNYQVTVTAVPLPEGCFTWLNSHIPPSTSFVLKVFSPCVITSVNPTEITLPTINRRLNDSNPTEITVPAFDILPTSCVATRILRLFERLSGSDILIATFNESTSQATSATSEENNIYFVSKEKLMFAHR